MDRAIDLCNRVLLLAERYHNPFQSILQDAARAIGDWLWHLRELPRLPAYRLRNGEWCIIFVGGKQGCLEIQEPIFKNREVTVEEIGRYPVMKLGTQVNQWLNSGADLVIAETSRHRPWKNSTPYSFVVPLWVQQIMKIPDDPEMLLTGTRMHNPRRWIKHAWANGFDFYHSRSLQDFELFHKEMYLPFMQDRHGEKALTSTFQDQYDRWFKKSGLIMVTRNGQPVAGELIYRAGDVCMGIEMGVLHSDMELIKLGINSLVAWSTILWCHQQKLRYYNLGSSHGWCENGPFIFKALWKAKVVRRKRLHPVWTFMAQDLPETLRTRMNEAGFIAEAGGKFYRALLAEEPPACESYARTLIHTTRKGLAGLALVTPGKTTYIEGHPIIGPEDVRSN
ncbi:MAG: GNAT family N-acetyltransferase [Chloroflexi bacterium]|nr:GNAT family N-acetyltransferase [Chloroflexota bacterium]